MNEFLNQPDSNAPDFTSFPHAMADFELPPQAELEIQEPAPHTDAVPQLPQAEGGEHAVPLPQQTEASDATYRPYFSFNATDVDPAVTEKLERIRQDAESHRALRLPGENPVTDEEWADIQQGHGGIVVVGDELGVDVRDRLPRREHYHTFKNKQGLKAYLQDISGTISESPQAASNYLTGIHLVRRPSGIIRTSLAIHEGLHDVSAIEVSPHPGQGGNGVDLKPPYTHKENTIMNEAVTDMATKRVIQRIGQSSVALTYVYPDLMLTNMVNETAANQGIAPQEIEDMLIRGLFTNNQAGLDVLKDALGEERVAQFMQLKQSEVPERAIEDAKALGLPWAVQAIHDDTSQGSPPIVFDWQKWESRA